METVGKALLVAALGLAAAGVVFLVLGRLGVTRLPGDLVWRRGRVTVYAPIGLMVVLSIVLTLLLNVFGRR